VESFLEMLAVERGSSLNTREAYRSDLIDFLKFCHCSETHPIAQIFTEENVREYCIYLTRQSMSSATVRRRLSALKQYGVFLVQEDILAKDPIQFLDRPKKEKRLPRTLSEKDVKSLFEATHIFPPYEETRALLMLSLLYGSGLRVSELTALQWGNIENNGSFLRFIGKGKKERRVPLCSQSCALLKEWRSLTGKKPLWIFPSTAKSGHLTRQRIFQILKHIALEAGLASSCLSPHVLRHAFATHLLEHGVDLMSLKKMLGHRDIATTEIYTHVMPERLSQTVFKHHPLAQASSFKKM
jgi:integrase/recombinase XerD